MGSMNKLWIASLFLILATPAHALTRSTIYKAYHYGIHYPVVAITFLTHMPTFILRYADSKADQHLQVWSLREE